MSVVCSLQNTSQEFQKKIIDTFTVRSQKMNKGKMVFGEPMKLYQVSDDKKWVSLPFFEGRKLFKPSKIYSYAPLQPDRPHMAFTGTLRETEKQDQVSAMAEALPMLMENSCITLAMRTGFGKGSFALSLINHIKKRALVVLCKTAIAPNWLGDASAYTNNKLLVIESTKQTEIPEDVDIVICMDTRLCAIPEDKINTFGTLVLDEAVDFCTLKRYTALMRFHPQKVIIASATPTRSSDGLHCMLELMVGTHKIVRINQDPFTVIKLTTDVVPNTIETSVGVDWSFLSYDLYLNERRNRILLDCVYANMEDHKILILTEYQVHVELLFDLFKLYSVDVTRYAGSQKSYTEARVLIGGAKKVGVGFDQLGSCPTFDGVRIDLVIFVSSTKQEELLLQYLGRAFRSENPSIIHFVDNDRRLKNHWRVSVPVYEKVKGVITEAKWDKPYFVTDDALFKRRHNECLKKTLETLDNKKQVPVYADVLRERLIKDGIIPQVD